jgi:lipoprotein-anchoring transpeptidase ErfK/SrfK
MESIQIQIEALKSKNMKKMMLIIACMIFVYLSISIYFMNHFFLRTEINGIKVSLKGYSSTTDHIRAGIEDYQLLLVERDGTNEIIEGQEVGLHYNENNSIRRIIKHQNPFTWIYSLVKKNKYDIKDVYTYDKPALEEAIRKLPCLNQNIIEPKNVGFFYRDNTYSLVEEIYGNRLNLERLSAAVTRSLLRGERRLNLDAAHCYEEPKYKLSSLKTNQTKKLLDLYVASKIIYLFGKRNEIVDGNVIHQWLSVDENLDVSIDQEAVKQYINELSKQYDSVGKVRSFQTSTGKIIEVKGGLYGWKINRKAESKELIANITQGKVIRKEPVYQQRALSRAENEIGNTYVEINITKQHLWFYKDGKLITQGPVVTGNPNRGNATVLGAYMINYKQKNTSLTGPGYDVKVTYWMPFFGNMGIHDASWRYSFGGVIYKTRGTHGCVNAPFNLAKTIFENIEEGIPVICYEEEEQ